MNYDALQTQLRRLSRELDDSIESGDHETVVRKAIELKSYADLLKWEALARDREVKDKGEANIITATLEKKADNWWVLTCPDGVERGFMSSTHARDYCTGHGWLMKEKPVKARDTAFLKYLNRWWELKHPHGGITLHASEELAREYCATHGWQVMTV